MSKKSMRPSGHWERSGALRAPREESHSEARQFMPQDPWTHQELENKAESSSNCWKLHRNILLVPLTTNPEDRNPCIPGRGGSWVSRKPLSDGAGLGAVRCSSGSACVTLLPSADPERSGESPLDKRGNPANPDMWSPPTKSHIAPVYNTSSRANRPFRTHFNLSKINTQLRNTRCLYPHTKEEDVILEEYSENKTDLRN